MEPNRLQIFPGTVKNSALSFVNADGTAVKTLVTAGAAGTRIDAIAASSSDTTARTFQVNVNDGATDYPVGQVTIPIGAGTSATLPVKILTSANFPWLDASGSLFLNAGWKLTLAPTVAVTAAKSVNFVSFQGDY